MRVTTRVDKVEVTMATTAGTLREVTLQRIDTSRDTVIPCKQGLWKSIKNICKRYGIQTHFKGNSTIKNMLVNPKDKDPLDKKSEAMYWYQCGEFTCDEEYIGETSRTLLERYKEHLKEPPLIFGHCNISVHSTNHVNFIIIGRGTMA